MNNKMKVIMFVFAQNEFKTALKCILCYFFLVDRLFHHEVVCPKQ